MILQVEARNYRCLRFVRQALPSFAVLAGPSGSGKSTLQDVPALLGDLVRGRAAVEAALARRGADFAELLWRGEGNAFELAVEARVPSTLWRPGAGPAGRVRYEVSIGRKESGALGLLAETLWLRPEPKVGDAESGPEAVDTAPTLFPLPEPPDEWVVCPPGYPTPAGWRRVVHKAPNAGNDYFRSEVSEWNNTYRLGPRRSALANLPEDEDQFPAAVWFRRLLAEGVQRVALDLAALRRPCPAEASMAGMAGRLRADGANLAWMVEELAAQDPGRLADWVAHVRTALPEIARVRTARAGDGHRYVVVEYGNGIAVPAWGVADGTLRLLALTLLAYAPGREGVWVVDAPEQGLHPLAVAAVVQALQGMAGAQVLVVTYAPAVLDRVDPSCVLCCGRDAVGATRIVSAAEHPRVRAAAGAVDLGTLFATGVLD